MLSKIDRIDMNMSIGLVANVKPLHLYIQSIHQGILSMFGINRAKYGRVTNNTPNRINIQPIDWNGAYSSNLFQLIIIMVS